MLSAVIDRFEEDKAVLLIGEQEEKVIFPKKLLEGNFKEGDYLTIDIKYDAESTKKAVDDIQDLLNSLKKDNK